METGTGDDAAAGGLAAAGLTRRELEVFWLVADRLRNREIAEQLFISERTVENHVASALRKLDGADRTDLVALAERLRRPTRAGQDLPRFLSSFVGRDLEVAAIVGLVREHRLVTLSGPAGVGKTRIALEVASSSRPQTADMPDPILVDLATVSEPAEVERAFCRAVGLVEADRGLRSALRDALRGGPAWLIVDNCEHVRVSCTSLLGDLLSAAGELRVLATSRGPLGVPGEVVHEVEPLPLPPDTEDVETVAASASGQLFADRARTASPGFVIDADNAADVAALCERLDGLPLALELAAARIRTFSPAELLSHLDQRFQLLDDGSPGASGRHRTLEAALRWSYDLLDPVERLVFERCSVFPGEFDYVTAAAIAGSAPVGEGEFLGAFTRVLERSLLSGRRRADQTTTYRMLESFRAFGRELVSASGGWEELRERHARHRIDHAVALAADLRGRDQLTALGWFERRWIDLHAAMRWSLEAGNEDHAWELLVGVDRGWEVIGLRGELTAWLAQLLERPLPEGERGARAGVAAASRLYYTDAAAAVASAADALSRVPAAEPRLRAMAALATGWGMSYLGQVAEAREELELALVSFRELGDRWHEAVALQGLGVASTDVDTMSTHLGGAAAIFAVLGDVVMHANCLTLMAGRGLDMDGPVDRVRSWLDEALILVERTRSTHERMHVELYQAYLALRLEEYEEAASGFRSLLPSLQRVGDQRCAGRSLLGLGTAALATGDEAAAGEHLRACLVLADRVVDARQTAAASLLLAGIEASAGRDVVAARLIGAGTAAAERLDEARRGALPDTTELRARLVERLGADAMAAAESEGHGSPAGELTAI